MSQLEKDLLANADERLKRWTMDTVWRCEMAGLSKVDSLLIIIATLAAAYCHFADALNIPHNEIMKKWKQHSKGQS